MTSEERLLAISTAACAVLKAKYHFDHIIVIGLSSNTLTQLRADHRDWCNQKKPSQFEIDYSSVIERIPPKGSLYISDNKFVNSNVLRFLALKYMPESINFPFIVDDNLPKGIVRIRKWEAKTATITESD